VVVVNIPKVEVADISLPGRICPHNVTRTRACHHCAGATLELAAPPRRGRYGGSHGAEYHALRRTVVTAGAWMGVTSVLGQGGDEPRSIL
jgi:hypothetical protein